MGWGQKRGIKKKRQSELTQHNLVFGAGAVVFKVNEINDLH
jgi:hypothetical protein